MFNEASYGFLNALLTMIGLPPVAWLSDPDIAIWSAVIANVWRGTAFSMILLYAGLLVIPRSLYEAASVDGATRCKQFWYITLPQLRPILLVNTILISIFTLNTFDLILPLTGGGPGRATEVLALYAYNTVFRNFDLSNGAVLAVMLLADQPRLHPLLRPPAAEGELSRVSAARRTRLADVGTYLAYLLIFLFFAGPLLWLFSLSIRTAAEIYRQRHSHLAADADARRTTAAALGNPLFPTYLWNGLKLAVGGAFGAMLFATPGRLRAVALPLPQPQPRDDRAARVPDDLAAGHHGAALPLHGPCRPDRQPLRRGLHLHRDRGAALHLDAEGLPRRHPAEPRGRGDDRRLHALRRLHARGAAARACPGLTSAFVLNAILGWSQFIIPFILL